MHVGFANAQTRMRLEVIHELTPCRVDLFFLPLCIEVLVALALRLILETIACIWLPYVSDILALGIVHLMLSFHIVLV